MVQYQDTVWCDGCGVEILWSPLLADRLHYCCRMCKEGYQCQYGPDLKDEHRDEGASLNTLSPSTS